MHALAADQQAIATALLDPSAPVPAGPRSPTSRRTRAGFAVHRNNVAASLIDALAARFPVVRRLAGAETFRAVAHRFIVAEPPRSPVLLHYGETFPCFIRTLGSAPSIEYLADLADLEVARGRAYHAADAVPVERAAFASLPAGRLASVRLALHPSAALFMSRFPIVSVWEANQDGAGEMVIRQWTAESALIARPFLEVEMWRLPSGGLEFLGALRLGATLAAAAEVAIETAADFDLASNLALLIESNIVAGFH